MDCATVASSTNHCTAFWTAGLERSTLLLLFSNKKSVMRPLKEFVGGGVAPTGVGRGVGLGAAVVGRKVGAGVPRVGDWVGLLVQTKRDDGLGVLVGAVVKNKYGDGPLVGAFVGVGALVGVRVRKISEGAWVGLVEGLDVGKPGKSEMALAESTLSSLPCRKT